MWRRRQAPKHLGLASASGWGKVCPVGQWSAEVSRSTCGRWTASVFLMDGYRWRCVLRRSFDSRSECFAMVREAVA